MMEIRHGWTGAIEVRITYQDGKTEVEHFHNVITNAGKNMLRDMLAGTLTDAKIRYVALGNGTTPASPEQVELENEVFRKEIVDQQTTEVAGQLRNIAYIASFEANFLIGEIGWFAGSEASSSPNTGTMIARVLWTRDKNDRMVLQIVRTDTITSTEV